MTDLFRVGGPLVLTCSFTVADVLTDPTAVSLTVTDPSGDDTTYTYAGLTIDRQSAGIYTKTVTPDAVGTWSYVWDGTGAAADNESGTFDVFAVDPVQTSYCTLQEVKEWLQITGTSDTGDDAAITRIIGATSRWIDAYCGKTEHGFWLAPAAYALTFDACNWYTLDVHDIGDTTDLTIATDASGDGTYETAWSASDYQLLPVNASAALPEARPYTEIRAIGSLTFPVSYPYQTVRRNQVQVTARWGWPAIPDAVRQACIMQSARILKRRHSPEGVVGSADFGVVRVSTKLDPDVARDLVEYRDGSAVALVG